MPTPPKLVRRFFAPPRSPIACLSALTLSLLSGAVQAEPLTRSLCVFDPVGASGPVFNSMSAARTETLRWGVDLNLKAYTDEMIAAEDFKAGQCDAVVLTGTRAREFNKFTGTLEALGAIPSYDELQMVLQTLAQPKAAEILREGKYEVAGIYPAGAVYLFMRDRNVDTVGELQGKKFATFDYDNAAMFMVRHVGGSVVGSNSSNFAGKLNNGSVDLAYAPAIAYTPLELYKGIADGGSVFNFQLAQMSFQMIIRSDRFPAGFGQQGREYAMARFDEFFANVKTAESEIPASSWVTPKTQDRDNYLKMFREVRVGLRDEGVYDSKALSLMRKVRCKKNPEHAECIEKTE